MRFTLRGLRHRLGSIGPPNPSLERKSSLRSDFDSLRPTPAQRTWGVPLTSRTVMRLTVGGVSVEEECGHDDRK